MPTLAELDDGDRQLALVVMPFAPSPWNLFELIQEELEASSSPYLAIRADHVADPIRGGNPSNVWTLIRHSDLILVDISSLNVNVYIELGVAAAWTETGKHRLALIGDRTQIGRLPFDLHGYEFHGYDPSTPESIRASVRAAVDHPIRLIQTMHPNEVDIDLDMLSRRKLATERILQILPQEVTSILHDPAASLLITRYIQQLGKLVGEELAANTGFHRILYTKADAPYVDEEFLKGYPWSIGEPIDVRTEESALSILQTLARAQQERDERVVQTLDVDHLSQADRRLLLVAALMKPPATRNSAELRIISDVLLSVAALAKSARPTLPFWDRGIRAVRRLTRLTGRSVAPTDLLTVQRIYQSGEPGAAAAMLQPLEASRRSEARSGWLNSVSTLGGALFLGHSIAIIRDSDPHSPYAHAGLHLARLTHMGQPVVVPDFAGLDPRLDDPEQHYLAKNDLRAYTSGLRALADNHNFVFAVEHPFHFRVLLELLSDENRRYPAESILNYQAARVLWSNAPWDTFIWFRDQLPVVVNIVGPSAEREDRRAIAFLQHYTSFGRTPHTSSFTRLEYDAIGDQLSSRSWWPEDLRTASAQPFQNLPNSVADSLYAITLQRRYGRLWRNDTDDADRTWLSGQLIQWNGRSIARDEIAKLAWNNERWVGLDFPSLALAEVQTGIWIIESLLAYFASSDDHHRLEGEGVREQIERVLSIVVLFAKDYVSVGGDSVGSLIALLDSLGSSQGGTLAAQTRKFRRALQAKSEEIAIALARAEEQLKQMPR